jgi:hypothetical protein
MPSAVAILRPGSNASYSAALLDTGKWICKTYLKLSPLGDVTRILAPAPWSCKDPSKLIVQYCSYLSLGGVWISVLSATKSLRDWALIAVLGLSTMLYMDNSMAHLAISWLLPSYSVSHPESMMCGPQSGARENSGIACKTWLTMHKRASWYENTESWSHSALRWWSRLDIGSYG